MFLCTRDRMKIRAHESSHYFMYLTVPKLQSVLTKANYINKTDVVTLLETFGNFRNICSASEQQMVLCPGIGEKKVKRLHRALHAPFMLGGEEESLELNTSIDNESTSSTNFNELGSSHGAVKYDSIDGSGTGSSSSKPSVTSSSGGSSNSVSGTRGNSLVPPPHPSTIVGKEQVGKVFDPSSCTYVDR